MGKGLGGGPPRIQRRREPRQHVVVEEVGERPMPDVVQQSGDSQCLDNQPLGRHVLPEATQLPRQRRVQCPPPQPGLVHDPKAVREPRVLGRREDPAGALELADAAHPLDPRRVKQVLLGDVLGEQVRGLRFCRAEPLRQLHVAVDGVADQVDRAERVARHQPPAS
jgi:hypothetical protein